MMPLVTMKDILPAARRAGHAIGAFNIANFETAGAVITAAEAEQQPVIMQIYHRLMAHPRIGALSAMMRRMAEDSAVPVAVHLDHGASLEQVRQALDLGFSSV
ncbi:MAG: class II fructose-bisphosphate aldolase, partial [Kiritimatiellia bacterium]